MNFAAPEILWIALAVIPATGAFLWWAWRKKQSLTAQFIRSRLLSQLAVGISAARQKIKLALLLLSVAFLFLALARPQWGFAWEEARQRGLDIVVAIDTSRSMLATDVAPNRITRAKLAALDLMRLAKNDRLGLVVFAGTAFLQCPLTLDEDAFRQSVNTVEVDIIPQGGTVLADAIKAAQGAFKDEGENHKVLVIFTDGEDHEEGVLPVVEAAAKEGMRIFTIGVGTPEGEMLRQVDEKGVSNYIKDDAGNAVKSRLNETLLGQIAAKANGFYLPMRGARVMDTLYERGLAPLPKGETSAKLIKHYHERFQWPLVFAMMLLLLEMFFPERPRAARRSATARSSPKLAAGALLFLALAWNVTASPASAARKYANGQYKESLADYRELLGKRPEDPKLHYNAGAAAYQAGDYDAAAKDFTSALSAPELGLQQSAYYNLGNSLYRAGEQLDAPDKKTSTWQEAVNHYESALRLNPADADAKFNLDLVKKKLEELKQQQQKQDQGQDQDKDKQDKDKQDDKKEDQKDQNKSGKKDQPNEKNQDDKSKDPQKDNSKEKDDHKQPQPKSEPKPNEKEDDQKPGKNKNGEKEDPQKEKDKQGSQGKNSPQSGQQTNASPEQAMAALGQMTPQQAKQILDSQKNEEKALLFLPLEKDRPQNRSFKNW